MIVWREKFAAFGIHFLATLGVAHKQTFDVECEIIELQLMERGIGGSRRAGEQAAASAMLQTLKGKFGT